MLSFTLLFARVPIKKISEFRYLRVEIFYFFAHSLSSITSSAQIFWSINFPLLFSINAVWSIFHFVSVFMLRFRLHKPEMFFLFYLLFCSVFSVFVIVTVSYSLSTYIWSTKIFNFVVTAGTNIIVTRFHSDFRTFSALWLPGRFTCLGLVRMFYSISFSLERWKNWTSWKERLILIWLFQSFYNFEIVDNHIYYIFYLLYYQK